MLDCVRRLFGRGGAAFLSEVSRVRCFVRFRVVRACVVVVASRAGSSGRVASVVPVVLVPAGLLAASVGLPAVRWSWCVAWLVLVGRAGLAVRAGVAFGWGLALLAVCGPRGGCSAARPPFSANYTNERSPCLRAAKVRPAPREPCLRAAAARPLRRDRPRGVFKRQRRLAKRAHADDQGLNQTSTPRHGVRRLFSLYATAQTRSGHDGAYLLGSVAGAPCGLAGLRNRRSPAVLAAGAAPLAGMPTSRQSAFRVTPQIFR